MRIRVPAADSCAFCDYLAGIAECAWVRRTDQVSSFVNLRQYERGALLVIPNRHAPTAFDLQEPEIAAVVPRYPDGDPQKVFSAARAPIVPFAERQKIADAVRARLMQVSDAGS